jgi:hypothetical protein
MFCSRSSDHVEYVVNVSDVVHSCFFNLRDKSNTGSCK